MYFCQRQGHIVAGEGPEATALHLKTGGFPMACDLLQPANMRSPIRILFVEDDPEMIAVYEENFSSPEFEIATATDGEQAVRLLRTSPSKFDVVVTDNYMPNMNGFTFLKRIHFDFPEVKLFMVTGYGTDADYLHASDLGVHRFLDKPVRMSELKHMIRDLFVS